MSQNAKEPRWTHCNRCNGSTKHEMLFVENVRTTDEIDQHNALIFWDDYTLFKCLGCDTVHLVHESSFSEEVDENDQPKITTTVYPPRISRRKPAWLGDVLGPFWAGDSKIEHLLEEIYVAMHNDSVRLAAMGVRALLEHIMIDKVGDQGSIGENIKKFFADGFVAVADQDTFRSKLIEAGHAAMHRGYKPDRDDLGVLLDLTESLIASIYVHPIRAIGLSKKIPGRANPIKSTEGSDKN